MRKENIYIKIASLDSIRFVCTCLCVFGRGRNGCRYCKYARSGTARGRRFRINRVGLICCRHIPFNFATSNPHSILFHFYWFVIRPVLCLYKIINSVQRVETYSSTDEWIRTMENVERANKIMNDWYQIEIMVLVSMSVSEISTLINLFIHRRTHDSRESQ